ncbi:Hypothetical predicted protein [Olea europaea subsp. europaea]|uniref:DUF7804 domain-containing protein n=1 Tax=Olea europaea subsp. europaea TaxID=158383 RepID=A0A8S0UDP8_OLEEU|nr:Hypothetical predicted protein [Olea europaea subsp. europaea]
MAAAIGINNINPSFLYNNKYNKILSSSPGLSLSNSTQKTPQKCVSSSITSRNSAIFKEDLQNKNVIFPGRIDSWMQESISDIVKNLNQAPLLVHIYSEDDGVRFKTEKAIFEKWPIVKDEWESGESKSPDGLIFVEELEQNGCSNEKMNQEFVEEGVTRAWGVVVQGKGVECGPACYLLKTSRVGVGIGLGCFCTHFCLVRVNNFRDSALEQFKDSWLLQ